MKKKLLILLPILILGGLACRQGGVPAPGGQPALSVVGDATAGDGCLTSQLRLPELLSGTFYSTSSDAPPYSEMAEYDVAALPHNAMISVSYKSFVDSVRAINPDWVSFTYCWAFGVNTNWQTSSGIYRDLWEITERNPEFFLLDTSGNIVTHAPTNANVWMWNFAAPGLADSLAVIYTDYMRANDNDRPHTGYMIDWLTYPFPEWAVKTTGVANIDPNQNGVGYLDDEADKALHRAFIVRMIYALREYSGDPNTVVMANGNAFQLPEFSQHLDGGFIEDPNLHYPQSHANWVQALTELNGMSSHARLDPPVMLWQAWDASVHTSTEAAAALAVGSNCWAGPSNEFVPLPRRLPLGRQMSGVIWSGDTARSDYEGGLVELVTGDYPWPFLISSSDGDTLSRGGGWPAATPVVACDVDAALASFGTYLSDSYGQTIGLNTIQEWAATEVEIREACCDVD